MGAKIGASSEGFAVLPPRAMNTDTICGANSVAALFKQRADAVQRLFYVEEQRLLAGPYCAQLAKLRKPYRLLGADEMNRATGTTHHGGIAAVAESRKILPATLDTIPRGKLLVALDGIGNPHNLGAIARAAAFFGVETLLLHDVPGAASPSDAAYRVAEGGFEFLQLFRTRDLAQTLTELTPVYRSVAASTDKESKPLQDLPLDRPIALVLGHEETGISEAVLKACRRRVHVQGSGNVQSLNVATAAAVLLAGVVGRR